MRTRVELFLGDITKLKVDAIVKKIIFVCFSKDDYDIYKDRLEQ